MRVIQTQVHCINNIYVTDNKYIFRSQRIVCFRHTNSKMLARSQSFINLQVISYAIQTEVYYCTDKICDWSNKILRSWRIVMFSMQNSKFFGSLAPLACNNLWNYASFYSSDQGYIMGVTNKSTRGIK